MGSCAYFSDYSSGGLFTSDYFLCNLLKFCTFKFRWLAFTCNLQFLRPIVMPISRLLVWISCVAFVEFGKSLVYNEL